MSMMTFYCLVFNIIILYDMARLCACSTCSKDRIDTMNEYNMDRFKCYLFLELIVFVRNKCGNVCVRLVNP